jgi:predicted aspartyl protease
MISPKIAKKLGIGKDEGRAVPIQLADGSQVNGRVVVVDEIRVGRATVYDSHVVILDEFDDFGFDGLLGMSFLGHFTFKIDNSEGKLVLYEKD